MSIKKVTELFPVWAIGISLIAFYYPHAFVSLKSWIVILLGILMFGMGMTLTWQDFLFVMKKPRAILIGTVLQYLLMPLIAFILCRAFALPKDLMIGVILVGTCPGGTASNLITYLAKGDVALSITLTTITTVLSVVLTPLLTLAYLGQTVPVPAPDMMMEILKVIMIPVGLGLLINSIGGDNLTRFKDIFPFFSVASAICIIGIVVALNHFNILHMSWIILLVVIFHNGFGFLTGYTFAKILKLPEADSRTIAIEVGMQNSGLGVVLAMKHFTVLSALPSAIFSIWHNICGSLLAFYWSGKKVQP